MNKAELRDELLTDNRYCSAEYCPFVAGWHEPDQVCGWLWCDEAAGKYAEKNNIKTE